jgi:predicted transposase/invertase (TIGR01784 family)
MMLEGLKESEEFDSLPNMISIWLANYDETKRKYHTHEAVYTFKETPLDSAEVATDKFRTFIVELPKVDIRQENISKVFKAWVYFLRNPEEIPPEFLSIPEVEEAMTELKRVSQNPKVRRIYNERMWLQDLERNAKAHSYNLGVKEGRMEGRIEGELSKARNMARKLLLRGMDLNDVIDITGLDKKDIINLMN